MNFFPTFEEFQKSCLCNKWYFLYIRYPTLNKFLKFIYYFNRHKTGKKSSLQDRAGHFGQFPRLTAAPTLAALQFKIFKYKILDTLYSKLVLWPFIYLLSQFGAIESLERPDFCFSREKIDARKFDWPKWSALSCIG